MSMRRRPNYRRNIEIFDSREHLVSILLCTYPVFRIYLALLKSITKFQLSNDMYILLVQKQHPNPNEACKERSRLVIQSQGPILCSTRYKLGNSLRSAMASSKSQTSPRCQLKLMKSPLPRARVSHCCGLMWVIDWVQCRCPSMVNPSKSWSC